MRNQGKGSKKEGPFSHVKKIYSEQDRGRGGCTCVLALDPDPSVLNKGIIIRIIIIFSTRLIWHTVFLTKFGIRIRTIGSGSAIFFKRRIRNSVLHAKDSVCQVKMNGTNYDFRQKNKKFQKNNMRNKNCNYRMCVKIISQEIIRIHMLIYIIIVSMFFFVAPSFTGASLSSV